MDRACINIKAAEKALALKRALLAGSEIILWGAGAAGRDVFTCLGEEKLPALTIWDTGKAGQSFAGREIRPPEPESPCIARDAYIILAFYSPEIVEECEETLSGLGYKNILSAPELLSGLGMLKVKEDYDKYAASNTDGNFVLDDNRLYIWEREFYAAAGASFNGQYLVQDLWAAKKIHAAAPPVHYDIGSRVDGFITHLLSFGMKTVLIDIRPLETFGTENLTFIQEDATLLSSLSDNSISSLSALCSLEHFGLGRYGDPLDPEAHNKAFKNIQRVMKPGGDLYISVPVSKACYLRFNAHRVYSPQYILDRFDQMELVEFSRTSSGGLVKNVPPDGLDGKENVGLFHMRKK